MFNIIFRLSTVIILVTLLILLTSDIENIKILAGILVSDGKANILTTQEVEALSKLPAREELLVKFLFLLQAPANQFVSILNAVPAKFVRTLVAIRDSKK